MTFFRAAETRGAVATGSPTYNPFENPSTPLASVGFDGLWNSNPNDAEQTVTPETAAAVGTFYRCMALTSTVIASCPIEVYRKRDQEFIDNPLFDAANDALTYTPFELMELVVVYLGVWGNAFVYKKRDNFGNIVDLKPLYPDLVAVKPGPDGHRVFLVKKLREDGTIDEASKPQVFTDYEIMHVPGLGFDGISGLPIVKLMSQTLGTAIAADKLAARFYSRGSQLGGVIKIKAPLRDQTQAEGIKARWMAKNAGVAHSGDVAVLDAETDFQSITIPPNQLQFLESRRWQTTEIARWWGIPPHLVGDVEKSTSWGSGIEEQNQGLITFNINGWTTRIDQRFTREVIQTRGHVAKINLDHLLRGNTQERYQALITATGGPFMTRAEARKREHLVPKNNPEYDELLPPQGIGPMEEAPPGNTKPAKGKPDQE